MKPVPCFAHIAFEYAFEDCQMGVDGPVDAVGGDEIIHSHASDAHIYTFEMVSYYLIACCAQEGYVEVLVAKDEVWIRYDVRVSQR